MRRFRRGLSINLTNAFSFRICSLFAKKILRLIPIKRSKAKTNLNVIYKAK